MFEIAQRSRMAESRSRLYQISLDEKRKIFRIHGDHNSPTYTVFSDMFDRFRRSLFLILRGADWFCLFVRTTDPRCYECIVRVFLYFDEIMIADVFGIRRQSYYRSDRDKNFDCTREKSREVSTHTICRRTKVRVYGNGRYRENDRTKRFTPKLGLCFRNRRCVGHVCL